MQVDKSHPIWCAYNELHKTRTEVTSLFRDFQSRFDRLKMPDGYLVFFHKLGEIFEKYNRNRDACSIIALISTPIRDKCPVCVKRGMDERIVIIIKLIFRFDEKATQEVVKLTDLKFSSRQELENAAKLEFYALQNILEDVMCKISPLEGEILAQKKLQEKSADLLIKNLEREKETLQEIHRREHAEMEKFYRLEMEKLQQRGGAQIERLHQDYETKIKSLHRNYQLEIESLHLQLRAPPDHLLPSLMRELEEAREENSALKARVAEAEKGIPVGPKDEAIFKQMEELRSIAEQAVREKQECLSQIAKANQIAKDEHARANELQRRVNEYSFIFERLLAQGTNLPPVTVSSGTPASISSES